MTGDMIGANNAIAKSREIWPRLGQGLLFELSPV